MHIPTAEQIRAQVRQPSDADLYVWRYFNLSRLVWMLAKKQLWLSRMDLLGDRFEAVVPPRLLNSPIPGLPPMTGAPGQQEERIALLQRLRSQMYACCWHASDCESDAMWARYCGGGEGVCIRTTYSRLKASVGFLPIGLVEYADFNRFDGPYEPFCGAWLKRQEFAADREVRVMLLEQWFPMPPDVTGRTTVGMPITWDPNETVEAIVVHPGADYSFIQAVTAVVESFAPSLVDHVWYSALSHSAPY
jgi:hypothetical protein